MLTGPTENFGIIWDLSQAILSKKPSRNKKGRKNLRYPTKKQSFSLWKDCFFVGYLKFFRPFLFRHGFSTVKIHLNRKKKTCAQSFPYCQWYSELFLTPDNYKEFEFYRKVTSRSRSQLFNAYVLWHLAIRIYNWIVARSTIGMIQLKSLFFILPQ